MLQWQLADKAKSNIADIRHFTKQQWGAVQSTRYLEEVRAKIKVLAEMPQIGLDRSEELGDGIHSCFVGNHTIYYEYNATMLTVWAILHQSMLPDVHLRDHRHRHE